MNRLISCILLTVLFASMLHSTYLAGKMTARDEIQQQILSKTLSLTGGE